MVTPRANKAREFREARGLSQVALAERASLTRQSVGSIEAGRAIPAVDVALRIARALARQVEDLFGPPDEAPALDVELADEAVTSRLALGWACRSTVVRTASLVARSHLDVVRAVSMGAADVGVATRDAALAFGLRFVPLAEERYDLVVPQPFVTDPRVERLLDVLVSQAGRRELESLGYDMSGAGSRVAEVSAA
jgi:DNA-binding XRE family transcriptional regulator